MLELHLSYLLIYGSDLLVVSWIVFRRLQDPLLAVYWNIKRSYPLN